MKIKLILIQKHELAIERIIPLLNEYSLKYNLTSNAMSIICNNEKEHEIIESLICHICNTCNVGRDTSINGVGDCCSCEPHCFTKILIFFE